MCTWASVCVALPQRLSTFDLASIFSLSNQAGNREGWCDMSPVCFSLCQKQRGTSACQHRGFCFVSSVHTLLQAASLFTPATIRMADQSFQNFSVTFLK